MDISTWFPHSAHFIVGMKLDSLGTPAIVTVGIRNDLPWSP